MFSSKHSMIPILLFVPPRVIKTDGNHTRKQSQVTPRLGCVQWAGCKMVRVATRYTISTYSYIIFLYLRKHNISRRKNTFMHSSFSIKDPARIWRELYILQRIWLTPRRVYVQCTLRQTSVIPFFHAHQVDGRHPFSLCDYVHSKNRQARFISFHIQQKRTQESQSRASTLRNYSITVNASERVPSFVIFSPFRTGVVSAQRKLNLWWAIFSPWSTIPR